LLTIAAALAVSAGTAEAATCYVLFDRFDNVVSQHGLADRSQRSGRGGTGCVASAGEYLLVMHSDRCPPVTFVFRAAGSRRFRSTMSSADFLPSTQPRARPARKRSDAPRRARVCNPLIGPRPAGSK
jgi:hypothetical protein